MKFRDVICAILLGICPTYLAARHASARAEANIDQLRYDLGYQTELEMKSGGETKTQAEASHENEAYNELNEHEKYSGSEVFLSEPERVKEHSGNEHERKSGAETVGAHEVERESPVNEHETKSGNETGSEGERKAEGHPNEVENRSSGEKKVRGETERETPQHGENERWDKTESPTLAQSAYEVTREKPR